MPTVTLKTAIQLRDDALIRLNNARSGTRAWYRAEDDLNYWQGKVANLEALAARNRR